MPKRRQKAALSETRFEREARELRLSIQKATTPFENDTAEKKKARIEQARGDRDYFARTYFPHKLTEKTPEFHKLLDEAAQKELAAVQVFRGGSKTTRVFVFGVIHDIIFRTQDYIQYFTTTDKTAERKLDLIRAEIEENRRLQNDFGIRPGETWTDSRIVTNDVCVDAMGLGSAFRGMTDHKGRRPTKVIVDDPDEDLRVESATQRGKLLDKISKAIIPGMNPTKGSFIVMGTAIHPECIIQTFMNPDDYKNFYKVDIPVKDPITGELAWPERFTQKYLDKMLDLIKLAAYSSEYLNQPINPETQELKEEDISYYTDADFAGVEIIATAGALDPSRGKEKSDFQAITIGHLVKAHNLVETWIPWVEMIRTDTMSLINNIFDFYDLYGLIVFGVESVAFQAVIKEWADVEAKRRGLWVNFEELPCPGGDMGKTARVKGTFPFYKSGQIKLHEKLKNSEFVRQLLRFPKGHDDGPDSAEMLFRLLRKYGGGDDTKPGSAGRRIVREQLKKYYPGGPGLEAYS